MIVGGFSYVGTLARPAQAAPISQAAERQGEHAKAPVGEPTYFRSISAISPGSLADVYQSMRARESSSGFQSRDIEPVGAEVTAAILSGAGIPAAMSAYGEVMETADKG